MAGMSIVLGGGVPGTSWHSASVGGGHMVAVLAAYGGHVTGFKSAGMMCHCLLVDMWLKCYQACG